VSFIIAWLITAVVAFGVARQGVAVVGDQVTSRRPAPLTAEEVRERLTPEADSGDSTAAALTGQSAGAVGDEATAASQEGSDQGGSAEVEGVEALGTAASTTTTPQRSATGPVTPDSPTSTSLPATPTVSTSAPSPVPPPTSPSTVPVSAAPSSTTPVPPTSSTFASVRRTYNLVGGSVALLFTPTGVSVQFATPKPGFEADINEEGRNGVRVEFESESHRSRVDGWWNAGAQDQVYEQKG
jgi:hypothetical protein